MLRAKPIMKDASLAALSDEKFNQTIIRDGSLQAVIMNADEDFHRLPSQLPETKGRETHELSCERLLDRKNSLLVSAEKYKNDSKIVGKNSVSLERTEEGPKRQNQMILNLSEQSISRFDDAKYVNDEQLRNNGESD